MKYLSNVLNELPKNCLFDKGKVGCGGTTLAIESKEPYIVCVPFQSLVKNKIAQYPNDRYTGELLGVLEGVTDYDIKRYLKRVDLPKIIVTYDSLPKVLRVVNPEDYNLLVDEYHILLTQYAFRSEAIDGVLKNFKRFKNYCFMTATPIEEEFILPELRGIRVERYDWDDTLNIQVTTVKCENVKASTCKLINSFLSGKVEGNAYIFVNSVKFIKEIVKGLKLSSENTRVIYSRFNNTNVGIPRGEVNDAPKKINLLTSTCFEGCDIYDEEGKTFIVSDEHKTHSLIDISTSVQQIAGRIRNSKYTGIIYHLYNNTRWSDLSFEEFKDSQNQMIEFCNNALEQLNNIDWNVLEKLGYDNLLYVAKGDCKLIVSESLILADTYAYKVYNQYSVRVNLNDEYLKAGLNSLKAYSDTQLKDIVINKPVSITFKEAVEKLRASNIIERETLMKEYEAEWPFIRDAVNKLGFEKIASLRFIQRDIKKLLLVQDTSSLAVKIIKTLNLNTGDFISKEEVKRKLNDLYQTLDVKHTATSKEIEKYYDIKVTTKRSGSKMINGYTIIRKKYSIN